MKRLVTLLLSLALIFLPVQTKRAAEPNVVLIHCVIGVLVLGAGCVMVMGLVTMCDRIPTPPPPPPQPPPPPPPQTNSPPSTNPPPKCLPHLVMGEVVTGGNLVLEMQSAPSGPWQTQYIYSLSLTNGGMQAVCRNAEGVTLVTLYAPTVTISGQEYAYLDFRGLLPETTNAPARFWRLVVQP